MTLSDWTDENRLALKYVVVDPSRDIRQLLQAILKPYTEDILVASTVQQGFSLARLHLPDVVITSCGLHDTGTDLCRLIRENPQTEHIPVVVLTTSSEIDDFSRYFIAGIDQIVLEPFRCMDVYAAIQQARRRNLEETRAKIPVLYYSGKAEYVPPEQVDTLIRTGEVRAFRRGRECAVVGRDKVRSRTANSYLGPERRKDSNGTNSQS